MHGLARGGVRRLLQLRPLRARAGGSVSPEAATGREERILGIIETTRAKRAKFKDEQITMSHGAGGKASQSLIEGLLAPALGMEELADAGTVPGTDLRITTDSFVVRPIRFPGGSIGELAVNGTVNDLAVAGARPLALSLSLVLEEGLPADELRAEVEAVARAAETAGGEIVAGGTKGGGAGGGRHQGGGARPRRLDVRVHDGCRAPRPACPAGARRGQARRPRAA